MSPPAHRPDEAQAISRGEARRERLVDAALTVIADVGPEMLTHRRVATAARVPLAGTTYWFSSKAELVRAALERAADRDLERLATHAPSAATWTRETFATELARELHIQLTEHRQTAIVNASLWMDALRRPELRELAERWSHAYVEFYRVVLRRINPAITDLDIRLISAAIDGLTMEELSREHPRRQHLLARDLDRLLNAFLGSEG